MMETEYRFVVVQVNRPAASWFSPSFYLIAAIPSGCCCVQENSPVPTRLLTLARRTCAKAGSVHGDDLMQYKTRYGHSS